MEGPSAVRLVGATVAFNEEQRIVASIRSLLDQDLPPGVRWESIWVVASGCGDRTAERARETDPRVKVIEESTRSGKAAAICEVFRQAKGGGDYLVLLNADAQAEPNAIRQLLSRATGIAPPFAVMGRPTPPDDRTGGFTDSIRLLWELHHRFHARMIREGRSTNLSDELLLLPLSNLPPIADGIVNDGGFVGAWLRKVGGTPLYAEQALVTIEAARRFQDQVVQRRRILWGHRQIQGEVGVTPTTWSRYATQRPRDAIRLLAESVRSQPTGWRSLLALVAAELVARVLASWDRVPPRRGHTLWETIPEPAPPKVRRPGPVDRISGIER